MKGKKMRHFEYKDITTNANKLWKVSIESKKLIVKFGRIGILNPATKTYVIGTTDPKKCFQKKEDAEKFFEKKIKEKISKGYIEK